MNDQAPTLESHPTPALVLDRRALDRNVARMSHALARHGVPLRQHVKTAKCVEVARIAGAQHGTAITVSTLREAEHFASAGWLDQRYAVGLVPQKIARLAALSRRGASISVITDDLDALDALDEACRDAETSLSVLIEIDVGQHRGGVAPDDGRLLPIAEKIARASALSLGGVLAHAGHAYDAADPIAIAKVAEEERAGAVHAAEQIRADGLHVDVVSVGSTPTALFAERLDGVTEVRAGVFVFMDLLQVSLGCAPVEDIALGVLSSVIGVRKNEGTVVLDAGALALSKDRSVDARGGHGFGEVRRLDGGEIEGRPVVDTVSQEHGVVRSDVLARSAKVGDRVRILPNHACITAAAHDAYLVVDGPGPEIATRWARVNGF